MPHDRNAGFLAAWNAFGGERIHVLGNHDTDGGYKRDQTVEWWGSPGRHYSRDVEGLHLVTIDGNDPDGKPGYACSIADDQIAWLERDLAATTRPTVVLGHQPIDAFDKHVRSAQKVRAVLAKANEEAGRITIEGRETEWVGPDPWAIGVPADDYPAAATSTGP